MQSLFSSVLSHEKVTNLEFLVKVGVIYKLVPRFLQYPSQYAFGLQGYLVLMQNGKDDDWLIDDSWICENFDGTDVYGVIGAHF